MDTEKQPVHDCRQTAGVGKSSRGRDDAQFVSALAAFRRDATVHNCVIRRCINIDRTIAYVVPKGLVDERRLNGINARLPEGLRPDMIIPVGRIPLQADGRIDEQLLTGVANVDLRLLAKSESIGNAFPGITIARAIRIDGAGTDQKIHLRRCLSDVSTNSVKGGREASLRMKEGSASVLKGPALLVPDRVPTNLCEMLHRTANCWPAGRLHCIDRRGSEIGMTYESLLVESLRVANLLRASGAKCSGTVILQSETPYDFLISLWGCWFAGVAAAPLPMTQSVDLAQISTARLIEVQERLGTGFVLYGQGGIESGRRLGKSMHLADFAPLDLEDRHSFAAEINASEISGESTALILNTSGSTGTPKLVPQSHRALLMFCLGANQGNQLDTEDSSLNWMPMEHIGAIADFHLRSLMLGADQWHVATDWILSGPMRWFEQINRHRIRVSWAPNFAFRLALEAEANWKSAPLDLSCLRLLINAGEAVRSGTLRRFCAQFGKHGLRSDCIRPTWGMSETCSGFLYGQYNMGLEGAIANVGSPIPGCQLRIVDERGQIVTEGEPGLLEVRGPTVMAGYFGQKPVAGWFNTGDFAVVDRGDVTIIGRQKEVLVLNGAKYSAAEIQESVEEELGIGRGRSLAFSVPGGEGGSEQLVIFLITATLPAPIKKNAEFEELLELIRQVRETVLQRFGISPRYVVPCQETEIPRTPIGKIRLPLLREGFVRGEFADRCYEYDSEAACTDTLPGWFFQPFWRPVSIDCFESDEWEPLLIFDAGNGRFGEGLWTRFRQNGREALLAETGDERRETSSYRCSVRPDRIDDFEWAAMRMRKFTDGRFQLLFLWPEPRSGDGRDAVGSLPWRALERLLAWIRVLDKQASRGRTIRVTVAGRGANAITENNNSKYSSLGAFPASILRVAASEYPYLAFRVVELDPSKSDIRTDFTVLHQELLVVAESEVAYREGRRWGRRLRPIYFSQEEFSPVLFRTGGCYLITGGLGGIGRILAKELLTEYAATVILIGRERIFEHASVEEKSGLTSREKILMELKSLPGKVIYIAQDISDGERLCSLVAEQCGRRGACLDGVIHLAGTYEEALLGEESVDDIRAKVRGKIDGTLATGQLLECWPDAFLIAFSSASTFFGGSGLAAYVLGNAFLEEFVADRRRRTSAPSFCYSWSVWEDCGMSQGRDTTAPAARGFTPLTERNAMRSLQLLLQSGMSGILVGLNGANQNIRRFRDDGNVAFHEILLYCKGSNSKSVCDFELTDSAGAKVKVRCQVVDQLPAVDVQDRSTAPDPKGAIEQWLANAFSQILGILPTEIGRQDSFFGLGGNSLSGVELLVRVEDELGICLSADALVRNSTVKGLGKLIEIEIERKRQSESH